MKLPGVGKANFSGSATRTNKTDGDRIERHKDYAGDVPVDVEPGDAIVAATRGFKHWFSTRDAGMTVESTMTVTLTCKRDIDSLMGAGEEVGRLAEKLAEAGCNDMDLYLNKLAEEIK